MILTKAAIALWPSAPPVAPSISSMTTRLGLREPRTCKANQSQSLQIKFNYKNFGGLHETRTRDAEQN
eukprot:scaffold1475_cov15-Tisochrysis_lutea.AAC.2